MRIDPVTLEVTNHRLSAIAEEMGVRLGKTGFSPNIKERGDYSCAVFDGDGALVAQAAHIPVHLASTSLSVQAALRTLDLGPGDVAILNDPFEGGTHLPDLTAVAPVFRKGGRRPLAWVANRAHHADIGGQAPGSMALASEIYQEGFRLPPVRLVRDGTVDPDILRLFLANTRVREEREGDLRAQLAALATGRERLLELADSFGERRLRAAMDALEDYGDRLMRATLRDLPDGTCEAEDHLDDDGMGTERIRIHVRVTIRAGSIEADFTRSDPQVKGSLNTNRAVTLSAVFYVMKCIATEAVPANDGLMRPVRVLTRPGSIVDALPPAAVAAGNVETSQRIVDVLFRALARVAPDRIPAASAGTMSNLTIGGYDPFRERPFSYYETIAGGVGASPAGPGPSGLQTHMTNTRNTPIEALEAYYPLRVTAYRLRRGSGGRGRHRGGEGLLREIEALAPARLSLVAERHKTGPWGLAGGEPGRPGRHRLLRGSRTRRLPAKVSLDLLPGDRVRVETPGGGGWGRIP